MQFIASKVVMLCITAKAFASPPPHMAAVSVKDDGFPEVVDLKEIVQEKIADADRFANVRESEWQQRLRGVQDAREQVREAVGKAKNETGSKALLEIQEAKDKLRAAESSMFSVETNHNVSPVFSDEVMTQLKSHNLDSHLDEARRQIQEARAQLHSEPLPPFAEDEEEMAKEAMAHVDDLIKVPNDLLPADHISTDKDEAVATINQLLHQEESDDEKLLQEEQELMKDLSNTIAEVDGFTKHFESQLQERLGSIQEARSQIRESMQLVDKLKNPSLDAKQQAIALEEVKQAKAKLHAEQQAMFSMVQRRPVLSEHIIDNLDDHLDEARQLIQDARARLAVEPMLYPGEHASPQEEREVPADHEQALKDIRRDVRTVRAAMAQQKEQTSSVVRTEIV
jgi:hypothetical protein